MRVEQVKHEKISENTIYFNILNNYDNIIGHIVLEKEKDVLKILEIFIEPNMRNMGYGTKSIKSIIEYAINNGYDELILLKHKQMNKFLEKSMFIKENDRYILKGLKKEYLYRKNLKNSSLVILFSNIFLTLIKMILGIITGLNVFILDAINSLSDSFSIVLSMVGYNIAFSGEDEDHPMGHEKIESIFSLIIGVVIFLSTLFVFKDLAIKLFTKEYVNSKIDKSLIYFSIILLIIKIIQCIYIYIKNIKYENELLKTIFIDYRNDLILNISIILGLSLSIYKGSIYEILFSLFISVSLLKNSMEVIKSKIYILMDTQDALLLQSIKIYILENYNVKNIHDMYMTRVGKKILIYSDIRLESNITLEKAHEISEIIEKEIKRKFVNVYKVTFHIEPMY